VILSVALGLTALAMGAMVVPTATAALPGLSTGFANSPLLTFNSDPSRAFWLGKAAGEGSTFVRIPFEWQQVAPSTRPTGFVASDPGSAGYNWGSLDSAVEDIAGHGLRPILLPYLAPIWAQDGTPPAGVRPGSWKPDPTQFGDFGKALATRYSGHYPDPAHPGHFLPHVGYYQAWNEPNLSYDISPAWKATTAHPAVCQKGKRTCAGWAPESPNIYRPMLNAFYAAVKGVNPSDVVLAGGTAPYGDPGPIGSDPKLWRVAPLAFDRGLFCLNKKLKKVCSHAAHLNVVDDHPYVLGGGPNQKPYYSDDVDIADMYKLGQVITAARRAGTVLPAGKKQLWAGEISWATNPPVPNHIAVSPAKQAQYGEEAFYLLWRQHVSTVLWLDIRDMTVQKRYNPFDYGGLFFASGTPKPLATSFWFPFVTRRLDSKHIQAWGRSPAAGKLKIERKVGGKWKVLTSFSVVRHQVFLNTLRASGPGQFRAQVGTDTSLAWSQSG
jgi:hypothetical protein